MKIRAMILGALSVAAVSGAWADAASKTAKIAELMQLTGARQTLHEVDGKFDQEEAARAWGRFYSENVTESDLDAILAYYRSPAGQADVSASRAALGRVQHYMAEKRSAAQAGRGVGSAPEAQGGGASRVPASGTTIESRPAAGGAAGVAPKSAAGGGSTAGSMSSAGAGTAPARPWDSPPRAPDGRIVPSPTSPERCEVAPSAAPEAHAVPPSGRSVVCVCTDEKGTLTRDPVIAESSGDSRVDSGAVKMARVDSGRYVPPTLAGRPQSACFRFAIDFRHPQ